MRRAAAAVNLAPADRKVLETIIKRASSGITKDDIRQEADLPMLSITKALRTLTTRKLIKKISANSVSRGNEIYMGVDFEPPPEVEGGGGLFSDGKLDLETVKELREVCVKIVRKQKVSTADSVHEFIAKSSFKVSVEQIPDVLMSLFIDKTLMEFKSTGLGECSEIPAGTTCYRLGPPSAAAGGVRLGGYASIPCGACPRISLCSPQGRISPSTCVYYTKWLDLKF